MDDAMRLTNLALVGSLIGLAAATTVAWAHFGDLTTLAKAVVWYCATHA